MAWIEVHENLSDHAKTYKLSNALKIERAHAVGLLINLWLWVLRNAVDGELTNFPLQAIATAAGWKKKPEVFVNALIECGWIDKIEDKFFIHDWFDYAGRLIQKRELNAERMRAARGKKNNANDDNVQCTNDAQVKHITSTCDERAGATVPNLTVPNLTIPYPTVQREIGSIDNIYTPKKDIFEGDTLVGDTLKEDEYEEEDLPILSVSEETDDLKYPVDVIFQDDIPQKFREAPNDFMQKFYEHMKNFIGTIAFKTWIDGARVCKNGDTYLLVVNHEFKRDIISRSYIKSIAKAIEAAKEQGCG